MAERFDYAQAEEIRDAFAREGARSTISLRVHAAPGSALAMPPTGRRRTDADGAALIDAWIASLAECEAP